MKPGLMIQESERGKKQWRYRVRGEIFLAIGFAWGILFGWLLRAAYVGQ
jgi:hypothetical protein